MRRRLFVFFMLIVLFAVTITGYISYDYTKQWILESTGRNLKSETLLAEDYIKLQKQKSDYDDLAKEIKQKIGKRVTIIRDDGKVVGESDLQSQKLENHLNRIEVKKALKSGEGTSVRFSNTEQYPMYYYANKFSYDNRNYVVRLSIQLNSIREIQLNYLRITFYSILIGIIISSLLVYMYLNIFTKPIIKLTNAAATLAQGNYEKRIKISSNDEIGQLGKAFNLMSQRLQETVLDLQDEKNKLISVLTSMEDGVIVVDNYEKIILINPVAKEMFKIEDDVTGKHFIEAIRNHDIEDIIKNVHNEETEVIINYPQNKYLRLRATKVENSDNNREEIGIMIVLHDITKIRRLEKMRSDFVANVSHELKTPLTSIKGFAETLKDVNDDTTRNKFLDIIYVESERLTRLINDILTLSELENKDYSINFQKLDLYKSINDVYHVMQPIAKNKNINMEYKSYSNNPVIIGDEDKFKQMMINLIDNSIKYSNEYGVVEIILDDNKSYVTIHVKDNGIGIPEKNLSRLFERFYRIDKARSRSIGGTGLGLAIVKHIVMILNGEIDVKSVPGKGTEFIITLPKSERFIDEK